MKWRNQPALACPIDNIGVSASPMAAFSGFNESHKPPSSSDARDSASEEGTFCIIVLLIVIMATAGAIRSK
jgi:hypothetical protein